MKIAVIGGNGKAGQLIVKEAQARGHVVVAIVRKDTGLLGKVKVIEKDLFDLVYEDIKDCDMIVNAFGLWQPEIMPQFVMAAKHLSEILNGKENRLLVVGSAGSLYVDEAQTTMFIDTPDMPDFAIPVAKAQAETLEYLRLRKHVRWTYLSPPVDFRVDGERTGTYKLGKEQLILSSAGESQISYADYAVAVIDEMENAQHVQARFSVVAV